MTYVRCIYCSLSSDTEALYLNYMKVQGREFITFPGLSKTFSLFLSTFGYCYKHPCAHTYGVLYVQKWKVYSVDYCVCYEWLRLIKEL